MAEVMLVQTSKEFTAFFHLLNIKLKGSMSNFSVNKILIFGVSVKRNTFNPFSEWVSRPKDTQKKQEPVKIWQYFF